MDRIAILHHINIFVCADHSVGYLIYHSDRQLLYAIKILHFSLFFLSASPLSRYFVCNFFPFIYSLAALSLYPFRHIIHVQCAFNSFGIMMVMTTLTTTSTHTMQHTCNIHHILFLCEPIAFGRRRNVPISDMQQQLTAHASCWRSQNTGILQVNSCNFGTKYVEFSRETVNAQVRLHWFIFDAHIVPSDECPHDSATVWCSENVNHLRPIELKGCQTLFSNFPHLPRMEMEAFHRFGTIRLGCGCWMHRWIAFERIIIIENKKYYSREWKSFEMEYYIKYV